MKHKCTYYQDDECVLLSCKTVFSLVGSKVEGLNML